MTDVLRTRLENRSLTFETLCSLCLCGEENNHERSVESTEWAFCLLWSLSFLSSFVRLKFVILLQSASVVKIRK